MLVLIFEASLSEAQRVILVGFPFVFSVSCDFGTASSFMTFVDSPFSTETIFVDGSSDCSV
jgi:hypothetical protein